MSFIHRTLGLCPCCPRHILTQLAARRGARALAVIALAAGIALDLFTAAKFGWL
jgi:hypothetical protein